jgi:hypothetical protein
VSFGTGSSAYTSRRIEETEEADILEGIPCQNNPGTIEHVIQMVSYGLFGDYKEMNGPG